MLPTMDQDSLVIAITILGDLPDDLRVQVKRAIREATIRGHDALFRVEDAYDRAVGFETDIHDRLTVILGDGHPFISALARGIRHRDAPAGDMRSALGWLATATEYTKTEGYIDVEVEVALARAARMTKEAAGANALAAVEEAAPVPKWIGKAHRTPDFVLRIGDSMVAVPLRRYLLRPFRGVHRLVTWLVPASRRRPVLEAAVITLVFGILASIAFFVFFAPNST